MELAYIMGCYVWEGDEGMNIEDEVCSKCGGKEIYIQADGKTLKCYKCKHEWLAYWINKGTESEGEDEEE